MSRASVAVGGHVFQLSVLDRQGAYWPLVGISSEPETFRWIERFVPKDVFYDVGANIGLYSIYASISRDCRCVALEPNPFSFDGLIRNTLLNQRQGQIIALCLAVGDDEGLFELGMVSDQSGAVGSTLAQAGDGRTKVAAMVVPLDRLVKLKGMPFPNHIKIDVDGLEESIVAGGCEVLSDIRVKSVLIEVCERTPEEVAGLRSRLEACGLTLSEAGGSRINWIFHRA
jgi:FkbM family methyltransferase